jgi:hypothetical protein
VGARAVLSGTLLAAAAAFLAAAASLEAPGRPRMHLDAGLLVVETPFLAWSFDTAWRRERLHDLSQDPARREDASADRPGELLWLRGVALRRLGLARLEEIPKGGTAELERLRELGYL